MVTGIFLSWLLPARLAGGPAGLFIGALVDLFLELGRLALKRTAPGQGAVDRTARSFVGWRSPPRRLF